MIDENSSKRAETPFIPEHFLANLGQRLAAPEGKKLSATIGREFGDPVFLAKHYIQPYFQSSEDRESSTEASKRLPAFEELNQFLGADAGSGNDGQDCPQSNGLFVLGEAGLGKTSLLVMLKLAQVTATWRAGWEAILLKLRPSTLEDLEAIKRPRRTILLLDGLHEDPVADTDLFQRVTQLLGATRHFHRVVVTCRTSTSPHDASDFGRLERFLSQGMGVGTVHLSPFSHTQMDKYLKRRFRGMKDSARKRAKQILSGMGEFRSCPLLLNYADDFVHSRCKSWNAFAAFDALVEAWLVREERRLQSGGSKGKGGAFDRARALVAMAKLAEGMQRDPEGRAVPVAPARSAEAGNGDGAEVPWSQLESRGRSLLRGDSKKGYHFVHAMFREYLVAVGLRDGVLPLGKGPIPATTWIIRFLQHADASTTKWGALDLSGVCLGDLTLHDADFSRAALVEAHFSGSVFQKASFDHANLERSRAEGVKFNSVSFEGTKAAMISLAKATISGGRMAHSIFAGSLGEKAIFESCEILHTLFADSAFERVKFVGSDIKDCSFKAAELAGATFEQCSLTKVRFEQARLTGATFRDMRLEEVSLRGADMRGAHLDSGFLSAVKQGGALHWKSAAWDEKVAKALKLSGKENERNVRAIDRP